MKFHLLAVLAAAFVSASPLRVSAQGAAPSPAAAAVSDEQVEVYSVKFKYERAGGGDNWLETEVALDVKPGGKQVSGEFLSQVRVTLNLGYDVAGAARSGDASKLFYRSTVEIPAVESGRVYVRFYLSPEIVKRDRLRGDLPHYLVELDVAGQSQKMTAAKASKDINSAAVLTSFKNQVSASATTTEGLLMPQYFTPFATDSRRQSPTFLRREMQR